MESNPKEDKQHPAKVLPGARPIYINQSKIGMIFFHGFTGSPQEGSDFAEYFAAKGFTVWVPLLPGHGTRPQDLLEVKWQDWLDYSKDCFLSLKTKCNQVIVCGQSMGGALALNIASQYSVDALVCLAAAVFLKDWRLKFLPLAKKIITYQFKSKGPDVSLKEAKKNSVSYSKYPLSSLEQLLLLLNDTEKKLNRVQTPTLLVHSKRDHTVTYENMNFIYNHIASGGKKKITLENSYHVISTDKDKDLIFKSVDNFFAELDINP
jgi:carboxylesterase